MRKLIKSSLSVALAALMSVSMLSHAGEAVAEEGAEATEEVAEEVAEEATEEVAE